MNCAVCDNSEFTLLEGVYYCCECSSQVKESRLEQSDQEGFSRRSLLKTLPTGKSPEKKGKRFSYVPWTTAEAYNIVLIEQVQSLIKHGASKKLKDVVLYIWCCYLQKCEMAFRKGFMGKETVPRLGMFASKRDISLLFGNNLVKKKSSPKKKKKRNSITATSDTEEVLKEGEPTGSISNVSDVDNVSSESEGRSLNESSDEDSSNNKRVKLSSPAKKTLRMKRFSNPSKAKENLVHEMELTKTLSICYLGLLYTIDHLLLSDVLRLVNEKKIPYLSAFTCFPPAMKLQSSDTLMFTKNRAPDLWQISITSAKLVDFLKLPKFKHRSLMPIVLRFVKDLNLPGGMIHIIKTLIDKLKKDDDEWYEPKIHSSKRVMTIPVYEVQAMASIIVALKLLFVLDGEYELEHSDIMMKLNHLKSDKLFIWKEWRQQMSLKEYLFAKSGTSYSDFSNMDVLSAELIAKYPQFESKPVEDLSRGQTRIARSRKEIRTLLEKLVTFKKIPTQRPSSFPLKYQLDRLMQNWDKMPFFKETKDIDFTYISKDLSSRMLFYQYDSNDEDLKESIQFLLSSLYESAEVFTSGNPISESGESLKTSCKYWFKNFPSNVFGHPDWIKQLPESFVWLLKLLSNYIHINSRYLYTEILNIEKKIFLHVKAAYSAKKY